MLPNPIFTWVNATARGARLQNFGAHWERVRRKPFDFWA